MAPLFKTSNHYQPVGRTPSRSANSLQPDETLSPQIQKYLGVDSLMGLL
jgi:hypothetical protein